MNPGELLTPHDKAELHRRRYELGRQMAQSLAVHALHKANESLYAQEGLILDDMRRTLWRAEYEALHADPKEKFLPDDIAEQRDQGIEE